MSVIACHYLVQQGLVVGKVTAPDGTVVLDGPKLDAFVKQLNALPSVPVYNVPIPICPPPIPEQSVTLLIFHDAAGTGDRALVQR